MRANIPLNVQTGQPVGLKVESGGSVGLAAVPSIQIVDGEHYQGPYQATPSSTAQVLETAGLFMEENVVIEPIPQQYGLISWDGNTLTVS